MVSTLAISCSLLPIIPIIGGATDCHRRHCCERKGSHTIISLHRPTPLSTGGSQCLPLPNDIMVEIIDWLPIRDINNLQMVCTSLCALLAERVIWHRHLARIIQQRSLPISCSHLANMSTASVRAEVQRQARLDVLWQRSNVDSKLVQSRSTIISDWPMNSSMTPGGRYLLTAMEDLSVLCWDLDKELTEPEVLVPKGPLFHETLVSFAADRLATHELLNFVLQTADGVVDIWSFDVPSMSEKRCTHNGSIRLESVAECVHLCGDVFSGYLINTGCAVSFSWKTLITDGQIHEYSSLRLPRECRDVCHLSTGQVLVVDSEEVALYPPPPYLSVSNIRRAEHSTTMAPIWRLERRMVDYMYQIIPGRLPGVESELIGTIVSENLLMDLFATDDGSVAVTTTNFDPNVQDVAVGTYRAATARTEDGVTDAWYLRRFSLSTSNSRASARLIAHPEVKLQYPEGIITPHRRVTLQWRLDEQSGRALYFVQSLKGESHLIVLDFA